MIARLIEWLLTTKEEPMGRNGAVRAMLQKWEEEQRARTTDFHLRLLAMRVRRVLGEKG